jgi:hypothetical protein
MVIAGPSRGKPILFTAGTALVKGAGMESYNVVFSGVIADGFDLEEVAISLREAFGISSEAKIKQVFSGNRVVLKKDLDRGTAWQFKEKLGDMGIVAELEQQALAKRRAL